MHPAWYIPEISQFIVSLLNEHDTDGASSAPHAASRSRTATLASLAALARTCQILSPIALDELWAAPGDLIPILKCLPSELWQEERNRSNPVKKLFTITRDPTPAEWQAIHKHAHRVKHISISCACECWQTRCACYSALDTLNRNVALWSRGPAAPLFPRLLTLRYTPYTNQAIPHCIYIPEYLSHLAGPNLQQLYVHLTSYHRGEGHQLAKPDGFRLICDAVRAFSEYTNLNTFVFRRVYYGDRKESDRDSLSAALDAMITRLPRLQSLDIRAPLSTAWPTALRLCPSAAILRDLDLELSEPMQNTLDNGDAPVQFPALHSLHLNARNASICAHFLEIVQAPGLHNARFVVSSFECEDEVTHLFSALAHSTVSASSPRSSHSSPLSNVSLSLWDTTGTTALLTLTALTPLFQLPSLTAISLGGFVACALDDTAVCSMASAWPALETLRLEFEPTLVQPVITVASLVALVRCCPRIQSVKMALDARTAPSPVVLAAAESLSNQTTSTSKRQFLLDEPTTPVADPEALALVLYRLRFEPEMLVNVRGWKEVLWRLQRMKGMLPGGAPPLCDWTAL